MQPHGSKERLWTRDLVLAAMANFAIATVFYLLMTTMAVYAIDRFSASDTTAGLASSMFVIGATIARLFAGNLADLVGRRRTLVASCVVFVLAAACYLPVHAARTFAGLLIVRAVHGVAFGVASTAATALAQSLIPASRRAEGTGYFTLSMTLATAIGPFLALGLVHGPGYQALFGASLGIAAVAMAVTMFLRTKDRQLPAAEREHLRRFHPRDMLHPRVLPVATSMLLLAICYSGVLTFLNAYTDQRDLRSGARLFFLVYAASVLLSRLVVGRVQDRRGDNVVVYPAIVAFGAGLAVLGMARSNAVVLLAGVLMGLGFGTLMSAMQSITVGLVPARRVGVAVSTHYFMIDLGTGCGPVLLGLALAKLEYHQMYLALAGLVLPAAAVYHLVHGRFAHRTGSAPDPVADPAKSPDPVADPAATADQLVSSAASAG